MTSPLASPMRPFAAGSPRVVSLATALVLHAVLLGVAALVRTPHPALPEIIRVSLQPESPGGRPSSPGVAAAPAEAAAPAPRPARAPATRPDPQPPRPRAAIARPRPPAALRPEHAAPPVAVVPAPASAAPADTAVEARPGAGPAGGPGELGAKAGGGVGTGEKGPGSGEGDQRGACVECPEPAYPMIARRRGWSGRVDVALVLLANGRVDSATIRRSSGHEVLDEEALQVARRSRFRLPRPEAAPVQGHIEYRFELVP